MPERLSPDTIGTDYRDQVTTQEYTRRTPIEGVQILDLRLMQDEPASEIGKAPIHDVEAASFGD